MEIKVDFMEKIIVFFNSSFFIALTTFTVGALAFVLYKKQKRDVKRDAAKIILQEIRRAEDIISDYKQNGGYQFAKKIIATNSWNKSLHLFVGDLDSDELDRISNLYSTGEYLDILIKHISDFTFKKEIGEEGGVAQKIPILLPDSPQNIQQSQTINQNINQMIPQQIKFIKTDPPWKMRLDLITSKLEPIYHSTIAFKLKKIAKFK